MRAIVWTAAVAVALVAPARSSVQNPFLGKWNITTTGEAAGAVYWLEIRDEGGRLTGMILERVGNPNPLGVVKIESGELVVQRGRPDQPIGPEYRARVEGGRLVGYHFERRGGGRRGGDPAAPAPAPAARKVTWIGVRPPAWPPANASGAHTYGAPVALFDGKSLDGWGVQNPGRPMGWSVENGALTNQDSGSNNLVSTQKFMDFKIEAEYKLDAGSNSGIYLRGRYELQILDDAGEAGGRADFGHMAIYGRTPPSVKASKPAGEWQTMEAVIVGSRLTVTLNGQRVHDNAVIEGITGGALDANEAEPGPILIQGDHRKVTIRKLVVTPISRSAAAAARQSTALPSGLFAEMEWRSIGPLRASRTRAATGHPSHPYTFYIGVCNGGVWKTTDAGRTWFPIFDDQPTQSIGDVVVAPSDPNIIYVGSGEGLQRPDLSVGDGIYKSTDAGRTWTHLGLGDGQQIAKIAVDPRDANRLFVAVLGHPYGPNTERGIFRSTNGGRSFERVLYKDENTGGKDVDIDPSNAAVIYATLWEARQGPWENAAWGGTNGGIFKSADGGATWRQLRQGLPDGLTNAEVAIAPSNTRRLYATTGGGGDGIFRSDDAGETWTRLPADARTTQRIAEAQPHVYPDNADALIVTNIVSFKSTDAGRSWVPFKGAPGGEDYQDAWINPNDTNIVLLASDQGGVVTLNGGETWSSWYNQPTAQLYHVSADNAFPYRLCSGQQESGSACVASRGNYGAISVRDWLPVGVDEYGYVAPDPLNPDIVYGGRSVTRFDRRTGQVSTVGPLGGRGGGGGPAGLAFRQVRTQPVVFSDADPRALFFGNNYLWKTVNGGIDWRRISPDLTRDGWDVPASVGKYASLVTADQRRRGGVGAGVIYTIGPSPLDINRIWIGTDDGLIYTTADGGVKWTDVTPPRMGPWWKVFMIDAGRFDARTAYAAVNTLRISDMRPHIYRTHDGGQTWTEIVSGLDGAGPANAVREDPKRKGLLYAATERGVYVSFDNGDRWQSLRQNLPASSVRDLIVKDDDIAVATHGRGFWILDDITPLRQIDAKALDADAVLFRPTTAWRVRWNTSTDMPWPKEEPTSENPADGVFINYYLKSAASGPVTLEVLQGDGRLVRRYSSADPVPPIPAPTQAPVPTYWYRPPQRLLTEPGLHRFVWDVHYQPLAGGGGAGRGGLPIQAIPHNTAPGPGTPWVAPGVYTVKLTVNGKSHAQPITVKQDPRVKTPALVMQQVYSLTKAVYFGALDAQAAADEVQRVRDQVTKLQAQANGAVAEALAAFGKKLDAAVGVVPPVGGPAGAGRGGRGGRGGAGGPAAPANALAAAAGALAGVMNSLQSADVQPTTNQLNAIVAARSAAAAAHARWSGVMTVDLAAINVTLKAAGLPPIRVGG
jgi:photosystem II stability/assembly factor-like uncharacterized protein